MQGVGDTVHGDDDNSIVVASLPDLDDGTYVVDWHVVSSDSHPINGAFTFGSTTQLANNTPQSVVLAAGTDTIQYYETDQFYFFEDNWKVRDNLTLNLGVRYEYIGQPINTLHLMYSLSRSYSGSNAATSS